MLVSIIIPTKNRCDLLQETLASVVAQTYGNWEAIVVDDGSNDGTEEFVRSVALTENRVRFLRRERRPAGASTCRNIGVSAAKGEYILFLDSDDLLAPTCLERRVKYLEENPKLDYAVFQMGIFHTFPGDSPFLMNNFTEEDDLDRLLRLDAAWQTTGPLWRKAGIVRIGPWDERALTMQDYEFHVRAFAAGLCYGKVCEIDSFWRKTRPTSMTNPSSWASSRRVWNRTRLYIRVIAILRRQGLLTKHRRRLQAAQYYEHAFILNRKRRLATKIWSIARREKIVGNLEFSTILLGDLLTRLIVRANRFIAYKFIPELGLSRTLGRAMPERAKS